MCWTGVLLCSAIWFCSFIQSGECIIGWTDPKGPISIEEGTRLTIKCVVVDDDELSSDPGPLSSYLGFYTPNGTLKQYERILNDTAIELNIEKAPMQESMFICKYKGEKGIKYNDIRVGHKPEKISHVDCVSRNWVDLTCTFKKPFNPVYVQYELKARLPQSSQIFNCNEKPSDPSIFNCTIPEDSYRKYPEKFVLHTYAKNNLGTLNQTFEFDNLASIIPGRVEELKVIEPTNSNNITITWLVSRNLAVFRKPFDVEISLNSSLDCGAKEEKIIIRNFTAPKRLSSRNIEEHIFSYTIPAKFANKWYDVGVRMKVAAAKDEERMWSEMAKIQAFTASRVPDHPPVVDAGSFNILPNGDVYIYWKHLSTCSWNGNEFGYSIKSSSGGKQETPSEQNQIYAVYRQNFNNRTEDTTITIWSKNSEGMSHNASTLIIPGMNRRLFGPTKINKMSINGTYILSWSPPQGNEEEIISYTVFWCTSKTELINQCESSIESREFLPGETTFRHESDQTVNFAISANSATSTSGMIWAKCTTANSYEIGKIRTARISQLTSTDIEVEWNLDCTDSGIVAGFQIEYCPTNKPKTLECITGSENRTNITAHITKYMLSNLKPYTTYKIIIRMFSNSTMGPPSEPLANTTLEDAPSQVLHLMARNVGNTSVDLYWEPPEELNGVLDSYDIIINRDTKYHIMLPKTLEKESNVTKMNYTIEGLTPFTDYDIAVEACTNKCSKPGQTKIRTNIGAPGGFTNQPTFVSKGLVNFHNTTYSSGLFSWGEQKYDGGHLDFYEVKFRFEDDKGKTQVNSYLLQSKQCIFEKMCESKVTGNLLFSVRAVNFVLTPHAKNQSFKITGNPKGTVNCENDTELLSSIETAKEIDPYGFYLYGPWSAATGTYCEISVSTSGQYILIMALMIASLVIVVMVFYLYRRIKDMKDILVQMPPGLEDLQPEKPSKKGKESSGEKGGKPDLIMPYIMHEDEHGRLLRGSMNGSINGADCSSSMHSESSRSDADQADMIDAIEYRDDYARHNNMSDDGESEATATTNQRPQSLLMNASVPKEVAPILISPESISASTPISEKFAKPSLMSQPKAAAPCVYVAPPVIHSTPVPAQINSNGYVTHSMLNPIQSNGYTQLNAFGKPILNNDRHFANKMNSLKTPIVATTDQEGISGYVTHKQLSDFGHRMQ